jgi:FdhD protein
MRTFDEIPIIRVSDGNAKKKNDVVVTEEPLTIIANGTELATIICTPENQRELVVGFLFSERRIAGGSDVLALEMDEGRGVARVETKVREGVVPRQAVNRVITPGCFFYTAYVAGVEEVKSNISVTSAQILSLIGSTVKQSALYRDTGGVHSAALCTPERVVVFREDIGRHNAIDKIIGHCLLNHIPMTDHLLLTSGRISSAVTAKIINARIPIIASSSAPTTEGVHLAHKFGVTLVGFARGRRITVYAGASRISDALTSSNG